MIDQHDGDAATRASLRADQLLAERDVEGSEVWRRVLEAIDRLAGSRGGGTPGNMGNVDAVEERHEGAFPTVEDRFHVTRLPPHGVLLQQFAGHFSLNTPLRRIRKFLVSTGDDYACPLPRVHDLIRFGAHERVGTHPRDLLPDSAKAIQAIMMIDEREWHDIRLGALGAGQSAEMRPGQQF
jgi:hypothetical protein